MGDSIGLHSKNALIGRRMPKAQERNPALGVLHHPGAPHSYFVVLVASEPMIAVFSGAA